MLAYHTVLTRVASCKMPGVPTPGSTYPQGAYPQLILRPGLCLDSLNPLLCPLSLGLKLTFEAVPFLWA